MQLFRFQYQFQRLVKTVREFSLIPKNDLVLGRWRVRHEHTECEYYIHNLHCDPGYSVSIIDKKRIAIGKPLKLKEHTFLE